MPLTSQVDPATLQLLPSRQMLYMRFLDSNGSQVNLKTLNALPTLTATINNQPTVIGPQQTKLAGTMTATQGQTTVTGSPDTDLSQLTVGHFLNIGSDSAPYRVNGLGAQISGTISGTNGQTLISGSGTSFQAALAPGQLIQINGNFYRVASITSNVALNLTEGYQASSSTGTDSGVALIDYRQMTLDVAYRVAGGSGLNFFYLSAIWDMTTPGGSQPFLMIPLALAVPSGDSATLSVTSGPVAWAITADGNPVADLSAVAVNYPSSTSFLPSFSSGTKSMPVGYNLGAPDVYFMSPARHANLAAMLWEWEVPTGASIAVDSNGYIVSMTGTSSVVAGFGWDTKDGRDGAPDNGQYNLRWGRYTLQWTGYGHDQTGTQNALDIISFDNSVSVVGLVQTPAPILSPTATGQNVVQYDVTKASGTTRQSPELKLVCRQGGFQNLVITQQDPSDSTLAKSLGASPLGTDPPTTNILDPSIKSTLRGASCIRFQETVDTGGGGNVVDFSDYRPPAFIGYSRETHQAAGSRYVTQIEPYTDPQNFFGNEPSIKITFDSSIVGDLKRSYRMRMNILNPATGDGSFPVYDNSTTPPTLVGSISLTDGGFRHMAVTPDMDSALLPNQIAYSCSGNISWLSPHNDDNPAKSTIQATVAFPTTTFSITRKTVSNSKATLTTSVPHSFIVGNYVNVTGVDSTFNGVYPVTDISPDKTTFSYSLSVSDIAPTSTTGSVAYYSWWAVSDLQPGNPPLDTIQTANEAGTDLWISVSCGATNDCLYKATDPLNSLFGLTAAKLNAGYKCYVEYTNEPWNTGAPFPGALYCDLWGDSTAAGWTALGWQDWYAMRANQVHNLAVQAFQAAGRPASDVVRVLGVQGANPGETTRWIASYLSENPSPAYAFASAPYFNNSPDLNSDWGTYEPSLVLSFDALGPDPFMDMAEVFAYHSNYAIHYFKDHYQYIGPGTGLSNARMVSYEGGAQIGYPSSNLPMPLKHDRSWMWAAHPRMRNIILYYLQEFQNNGCAYYTFYEHCGHMEDTGGTNWNVYSSIDQQPGKGDGSDPSGYDNRSQWANYGSTTLDQSQWFKWDPTKKISVIGGAIKDWNALVATAWWEVPLPDTTVPSMTWANGTVFLDKGMRYNGTMNGLNVTGAGFQPPTGSRPGANGDLVFTGASGQSIDFSTSARYPGQTNKSFSVSFWANPDNLVQATNPLWQHLQTGTLAGWSIGFAADSKTFTAGKKLVAYLRQDINNDYGVVSQIDVIDGNWHQYVVAFDLVNHTITMYRDGQLLAITVDNQNGVFPNITTSAKLLMADHWWSGTQQTYSGRLDQIVIVPRVLNGSL